MPIYLKNNPTKFHPDQICNEYDGALGFFEDGLPNKNKKKNKMSSDMRSVPDLEVWERWKYDRI